MDNKNVFASNLKRYMKLNNKSRKEVCEALGFSYFTFSDWVNGKKYPRMDSVEKLADYFGILKSDLIEEKLTEEIKEDNDSMATIIVRMRMDKDFLETVKKLSELESDKLAVVSQFLNTFVK